MNKNKIFYIADCHFGHENIIAFDGRPFENVDDMNEKMKENWNLVVSKNDLVYILGDFMWKFKDEDIEFMKGLNGRKRLIKGNHDKAIHSKKFKNLFENITDYEKIKDGENIIILSHYPMIAYEGSYEGRNIHLFGHVHVTKENDIVNNCIKANKCEEFPMKMYNVGAMMPYMNYTPQELSTIISKGSILRESNVNG